MSPGHLVRCPDPDGDQPLGEVEWVLYQVNYLLPEEQSNRLTQVSYA